MRDVADHRDGGLGAQLARWFHSDVSGGIILLCAAAAALVLANSLFGRSFLAFWETPVGFAVGGVDLHHTIKFWVNDALMVVFFYVVGLEVKREVVLGELREVRKAALPIIAALGGMVVPAAIYFFMQRGEPGERGWGIPMATDIAFVVGCMALVGRSVPHGLRVLLLTLAIADDVGAIIVIAFGYSSDLHLPALVLGLLGIGLVVLLTRLGVRFIVIYILIAVGVWHAFHESGIHATIAGVLLGLATPATPLKNSVGESPLDVLKTKLHPWVNLGIMPLFAFVNAGVRVEMSDFQNPVATAVICGLVIGKPVGIFGFSWLAVKAGLAKLPSAVSWPVLMAGGALAGIGFTMSIFIAGLALRDDLLDAAKIGVLAGSGVAAVAGMSSLWWLGKKPLRPTF